jgi:hypothetical protein
VCVRARARVCVCVCVCVCVEVVATVMVVAVVVKLVDHARKHPGVKVKSRTHRVNVPSSQNIVVRVPRALPPVRFPPHSEVPPVSAGVR